MAPSQRGAVSGTDISKPSQQMVSLASFSEAFGEGKDQQQHKAVYSVLVHYASLLWK